MNQNAMTGDGDGAVPAKTPDAEVEALVDAEKTFKISVAGAVLFCLAALYIIMSTRMG